MVLLHVANSWLNPSHRRALQPKKLGPTCRAPAHPSSHYHCHTELQPWHKHGGRERQGLVLPLHLPQHTMARAWEELALPAAPRILRKLLVTTQNRYLPPAMQILPHSTKRHQLSNLASLVPANLGPSASVNVHGVLPSNKPFWPLLPAQVTALCWAL